MITAQTPAASAPHPTGPAPAPAPETSSPSTAPPAPVRAALAAAIDAQAHRMDQLSAAIVRATAQVAWSGRAAERFRARAAERSRECLQLAVALRASADRVHAAAMGPGPDRANAAARSAAAGSPAGGAVGGAVAVSVTPGTTATAAPDQQEPVAMSAAGAGSLSPGYTR